MFAKSLDPRIRHSGAILTIAGLVAILTAVGGCSLRLRDGVVNGIMQDMQSRSEETTYQSIRGELERADGRLIPP